MAKDVDLSSSKWLELVFEGKNKDYGAYTMREKSASRHNKAMLAVIIFIAALAIIGFFTVSISKFIQEQEEASDANVQVETELMNMDDQEEEIEEEQVKYEEPEIPEIPEEVLSQTKSTEFAIAADSEVTEEIKSQDELKEDTNTITTQDVEGTTDDITIAAAENKDVHFDEPEPPKPVENKVYDVVEQMPVFPGGEAALLKYVSEHIRYPETAASNNVQGRVVVKFVVTKSGKVGDVQVVRSKDPDLDKEAVRVVKTLPKFTPGKMNGHEVDVWYTLPITFKLQGV